MKDANQQPRLGKAVLKENWFATEENNMADITSNGTETPYGIRNTQL